jgi:hypothetical protein
MLELDSRTETKAIEYPPLGFVPELATSNVWLCKSIVGIGCLLDSYPCNVQNAANSFCEFIDW